MKNPLKKRLLRLLREELGKYLVIFIFMVASIGFVSGFLVADGSMIRAYNESFEKYNIEDGKFEVDDELTKKQITKAEKQDICIYENFYVDETVADGSTMRIFRWREEIDKVCLMDGERPSEKTEIAIDRMYADNNGISVGDTLEADGKELTVSGLVALSDYSALFADNNDSMFDSDEFGVSVMTEEGFKSFPEADIRYSYSWIYNTKPKDDIEANDRAETLMKKLNAISPLREFVPAYINQAIRFTGEDMGGDRSMMITLLYVIIVIMAFVFAVTTSNTITKEANVIGTLRASGYTRGELVRHYMTLPVIVTLVGAGIGNVLGYTAIKNVCVDMYYGSYSLPTYETIWNGEAFVLTTIVPLILMLVINFIILERKLALSPIKFIRRDLRKGKQRRAVRLPGKLGFFTRFRLRVIFQNLSSYAVLFAGIIFANMLLMFGLLLPAVLKDYQKEILGKMICGYQYILSVPDLDDQFGESALKDFIQEALTSGMDTENPDAEKYCVYSLKTLEGEYKSDVITVYGIIPDSRYIKADLTGLGEGEVLVCNNFAEKYKVKTGDTITLKEPYEEDAYDFTVAGTYDYPGSLSVFMSQERFQRTFDKQEDYYNGYFSDSEITDVNDDYVESVIDEGELTKLTRQLMISMGGMMYLVDGFAVSMFIVLIYLLSKMIIEKNEHSISMVKILGYENKEISRLYILSTSIVVVLCLIVSLPIEKAVMKWLFLNYMMKEISGWLTFTVNPVVYIKMMVLGVVSYAVVAALEYRRIGKVPMGDVLTNE